MRERSYQNRIIDISRYVSTETPVYPGDTAFQKRWLTQGDVYTSEVMFTPHVGTHIDAPWHFGYGSCGMENVPLDLFVGPCQVITPLTNHEVLAKEDVDSKVITTTRILFAMKYEGQGLSSELVQWLSELGVRVIGTSSDSIDAISNSNYPAHHTALNLGMFLIENLDLNQITDGQYELHAVPLKWVGVEASPVRAYLIR